MLSLVPSAVTLSGMTQNTAASYAGTLNLFSISDAEEGFVEFDLVVGQEHSINIVLETEEAITYVFVSADKVALFDTLKQIDVSVTDSTGLITDCTSIVWPSVQYGSSDCASTVAVAVKLILVMDSSTATSVGEFSKIVVLGAAEPDPVVTITEDAYSEDYSFDVLTTATITTPIPTIAVSPEDCYSITWTFHRSIDDLDVSTNFPTLFSLGATDLVIYFNGDYDFFNRQMFYQSNEHYFVGTLSNDVGTQTSQIKVTYTGSDACQGATINA